ncbi:unnamed protein product, partial [Boreogadus saida]
MCDTDEDSIEGDGDTKGEQQRETDSDGDQEKPASIVSLAETSGIAEDSTVHSAAGEVVDLTSYLSYDSEVFIRGLPVEIVLTMLSIQVVIHTMIQLDDAFPVLAAEELEVINVSHNTSTPFSEDHTDHSEFLDCAAEGTEIRVPCLSPKWQEEEWKAVGRILSKGFMDQGYFPLRLAPAFTTALIFGEHAVSSDILFESLLLYLSHCERDLLATALKEDLDSDGQDELFDLLDRMGVKTVPSRDNLKAVLLQVAHKQLIQTPKYALDNMSAVAGKHLRTNLTTPEKIQCMSADKKPTCRKVLKLIDATPVTPADRQALGFLQQYIRGLDEMGLRRLLRFVTGSDVICVTGIQVTFTALEGLARRPVAHTCGPLLELPSTYYSYPELHVEMENVLTSNYYTMDIV